MARADSREPTFFVSPACAECRPNMHLVMDPSASMNDL